MRRTRALISGLPSFDLKAVIGAGDNRERDARSPQQAKQLLPAVRGDLSRTHADQPRRVPVKIHDEAVTHERQHTEAEDRLHQIAAGLERRESRKSGRGTEAVPLELQRFWSERPSALQQAGANRDGGRDGRRRTRNGGNEAKIGPDRGRDRLRCHVGSGGVAHPAKAFREPSADGRGHPGAKPAERAGDCHKRQRAGEVLAADDLTALARIFLALDGGFLGAIALP